MSTKKSEDRALSRVRHLGKFKPSGEGASAAPQFDAPFEAFIKASDPPPKPPAPIENDALAISIGGAVQRPYSEKRMALGKGDVSGWPQPTVTLTPEEHQAQADRALAAGVKKHAERRGPRKNYQPKYQP